MGRNTAQQRRWEDGLATELGLRSGEVVLDFPVKRAMFQLNVLVSRPGRPVRRLGSRGIPGLIDLPALAQRLYRTARVLRLFTFRRRSLDAEDVLERLARPAATAPSDTEAAPAADGESR